MKRLSTPTPSGVADEVAKEAVSLKTTNSRPATVTATGISNRGANNPNRAPIASTTPAKARVIATTRPTTTPGTRTKTVSRPVCANATWVTAQAALPATSPASTAGSGSASTAKPHAAPKNARATKRQAISKSSRSKRAGCFFGVVSCQLLVVSCQSVLIAAPPF
jgi:hypothetical protein